MSNKSLSFTSRSVVETLSYAQKFAKKIKSTPILVLLEGPVGAGKSVWVHGFVKGYLGRDDQVTSPTYSIVNTYSKGRKRVVHVDLYRIQSSDDLESIGLWDFLEQKNVVLVEWGNLMNPQWPKGLPVYKVSFEVGDFDQRHLKILNFSF